jgi:hypothetical protein
VVGTSATTHVFEIRILDGASVNMIELQTALEAFKNYFENPVLLKAGGFDVTT